MAEGHVKQLVAAREKLVADRRELAEALAKPFERGHTDSRDKFVAVQMAIEAIDRALQDEQPAGGPGITGPSLLKSPK
jgi:hypothetical protein